MGVHMLRNITMNKASGGDGILAELFQILKYNAVKLLHSMCQQIWKTAVAIGLEKRQCSFQSQRREMPKSIQASTQLCSLQMSTR